MTGPAEIKLYDSATRSTRTYEPLVPGTVRIYDCGPTVYSYQHIGNLYRYIVADVVRRTFEYAGYTVTQVMNITDVGHLYDDADQGEDKMEAAARREKRDPSAIAKHYVDQFMDDRAKLNILVPTVMPYATAHVPEMISAVAKLIENGHAYAADDGVYFDVTTFPGYGTRLNPPGSIAERQAGARVDVNDNKKHPFDFALWRAAKLGDLQQWDSPWGRGNPGWHIECSVMSMKYLGETFDIHSGGEDHLFPHHECEIAQSEALTGKLFVRNWMHTYFLSVDGGAMHKSKGNVYLVSDFAAHGCEPLAFRMLALGVGYRKSLDFTWKALQDAQRRLERWRAAIGGAWQRLEGSTGAVNENDQIRIAFLEAVADDFNTPKALAQAEAALNLLNAPEAEIRARGLALLFDIDRVLGLSLRESAEATVLLGDEERRVLADRAAARAAKDFAKSDALRAELEKLGIRVLDTKEGQRWERLPRGGGAAQ